MGLVNEETREKFLSSQDLAFILLNYREIKAHYSMTNGFSRGKSIDDVSAEIVLERLKDLRTMIPESLQNTDYPNLLGEFNNELDGIEKKCREYLSH